MSFSSEQIELLSLVDQIAKEQSIDVYVVGGMLRDLLMGQDLHDADLDFLVVGDASQCAARVQRKIGGELKIFSKFLTAKILSPDGLESIHEVDFASARKEAYPRAGALPSVEPANLKQDLARRDFSINALALALDTFCEHLQSGNRPSRKLVQDHVIDLFGGLSDLAERRIEVLHSESFRDDPTRLFRACRYATRLAGSMGEKTKELFGQAVEEGNLKSLSIFRMHTEVLKALCERRSSEIVSCFYTNRLLSSLGFIDEHKRVELLEALVRLDELFLKVSGVQWVSMKKFIGEALLYRFVDKDRQADYFKQRNYPKKIRVKLLQALEFSENLNDNGTTESAILAAALCADHSDRARKILSNEFL